MGRVKFSEDQASFFLERHGNDFSVRELASKWGWSKSSVQRFFSVYASKKVSAESSFFLSDHLAAGTLESLLTDCILASYAYSKLSIWDTYVKYCIYIYYIYLILEYSNNILKKQEKNHFSIHTCGLSIMELFEKTETDLVAEENPKGKYTSDFEDWYSRSIRKEDKHSAYKYYLKAKKKVNAALLLLAWDAYNKSCLQKGTDKTYVKKPYTWLRDEMYMNYEAATTVASTKRGDTSRLSAYEQSEHAIYPEWYKEGVDGFVIKKSINEITI